VTNAVAERRRGVLDTNTLIALSRITDASSLPQEPLITAVTLAELSVGPLVAATDAERAARQAHLQQAEADFDPLPFDAPAARAFGRVAASLRRAGRKVNARAYDAMIAAIALANGLPVYTCNPDDFVGIEGLDVVPVTLPPLSSTVVNPRAQP
jgi:tRNA(fMet)-specific endonuclease VapC